MLFQINFHVYLIYGSSFLVRLSCLALICRYCLISVMSRLSGMTMVLGVVMEERAGTDLDVVFGVFNPQSRTIWMAAIPMQNSNRNHFFWEMLYFASSLCMNAAKLC
jgi:hypothetical protein